MWQCPRTLRLDRRIRTVSTGGEIETLVNSFTIVGVDTRVALGHSGFFRSSGPDWHFAGDHGQCLHHFQPGQRAVEHDRLDHADERGCELRKSGYGDACHQPVRPGDDHHRNPDLHQSFQPDDQLPVLLHHHSVECVDRERDSAVRTARRPGDSRAGGGIDTIWSTTSNPVTAAGFYPLPVVEPYINELQVRATRTRPWNVTVPSTTPPGNYEFYMATGGQIVNSSLCVYAATPSVSITPANGLVPTAGVSNIPVTFNGQFTHWSERNAGPIRTRRFRSSR